MALAVALAAGAGCATDEALDAELAPPDQALVGSLTTRAPTGAPYDSVVRIEFDDPFGGTTSCVATKVGHRRLLTSAFCLQDGPWPEGTIEVSGSGGAAASYTVASVHQHPTFEPYLRSDGTIGPGYDVGLIVLKTDLPPWPDLSLSPYVAPGTVGELVGFGCSGATKWRTTATAATFEDYAAALAPWPGAAERGFAYHVITEAVSSGCYAQRGMPLLVPAADGSWHVGAVSSGGSSSTGFDAHARVGNLQRWIQSPNALVGNRHIASLLNAESNYCMGVSGASNDALAPLGQFYCDARSTADHTYWRFVAGRTGQFQIVNGKSQKCIAVSGDSTADDAPIIQDVCGAPGAPNQAWRVTAFGSIQNVATSKCIGVAESSHAMGAALVQRSCASGMDRLWKAVR